VLLSVLYPVAVRLLAAGHGLLFGDHAHGPGYVPGGLLPEPALDAGQLPHFPLAVDDLRRREHRVPQLAFGLYPVLISSCLHDLPGSRAG